MKTWLWILGLSLCATGRAEELPRLEQSLGTARACTCEELLTVTTGAVTQRWRLVRGGLSTVWLRNDATGKAWCATENETPDWAIYGVTEGQEARLASLSAVEDDDQGFTGRHLKITALFEYPAIGTVVRYEIRAYPGACGLFTRLAARGEGAARMRGRPASDEERIFLEHRSDREKVREAAFDPPQPNWYNSVAYAPDRVDISAGNLRPGRPYRATFTFWNGVSKEPIDQRIVFACGRRSIVLASHVRVEPHASRPTEPFSLTVDIPAEAVTDSAATISLRAENGGAALASEVWICERSDRPAPPDLLFASPRRRREVLASVPDGYRLIGYNDLGTKTGMRRQAPNGYVCCLPIDASAAERRYVGYYTDTQNRNTRDTPLWWEEVLTGPFDTPERIGIASALFIEAGGEGLALVKESHKCVNQYGVDTGDFRLDASAVVNSGLGFEPADIGPDAFVTGWANWTIVYAGKERELALKRFDRARFPVRQCVVMSNTWGSNDRNPKYSARESNVLREIASAADLGIEAVQVDDGWQGITYANWRPATWAETAGTGRYEVYPHGWRKIREAARRAGVSLGLWFAWHAPEEEIARNMEEGGFVSIKLDFSQLDTRAKVDALMHKARAVLLRSARPAAVNWDLTEIAPRVGYFYGREYGNVYLENRKPNAPARIVYTPWLVLRDAWQLARYANLNQFQLTIQRVASVSRRLSDAYRYGQGYATAIALMGSPLFFCETHDFDPEACDEVRTLIEAYKRERDRIVRGYVSPIGEEPDNASWTGFQNRAEGSAEGYLMLFREADNRQPVCRIRLEGCAGRRLRVTDLVRGETVELEADDRGSVLFRIDSPADFRFYRYVVLEPGQDPFEGSPDGTNDRTYNLISKEP